MRMSRMSMSGFSVAQPVSLSSSLSSSLSLATLIALVMAVLLSACASDGDRPKPAPLAPVLPLMGARLAWKAAVKPIGFALSVRVVADNIYVADSAGTVAAIDAKTGADVWRTDLATPLSAGVGSDGHFAAVVTSGNELVVLDNGKPLWRTRLSALTLTAPLVAGERVFVVSAERTVYAFDAATGRKLWSQPRNADPLVLGQAGLLTAVGDTLVVGMAGHLVGMNPGNGATRWDIVVANSRGTNEVERLADVVDGFSRNGDQMCVRAFQYAITCTDARAGKVQWTHSANGGNGIGGDTHVIVAAEADGRIAAYQRAEGTKLWEVESLRYRVLSGPLVVGKAAVLGDADGNLHMFSTADGSPLNRLSTDSSGISVAPVLAAKLLVAVTRGGGIYAFRSE